MLIHMPNPVSILSLLLLGSSCLCKAALLGAAAHLVNSPIASEQLSKPLPSAERT